MKIRGAGVCVYMCWRSLSRWGSFAAVILTVCFIAISSSSSSDATGEEAQPVPIYYYIKELTSTYTHTQAFSVAFMEATSMFISQLSSSLEHMLTIHLQERWVFDVFEC